MSILDYLVNFADTLPKLAPILVIIALGFVLTKIGFLNDKMADSLKKIVVNVTLPIGLFSSFIKIRFQLKFVLVFASVYITCLLLLNIGKLIAKIFRIKNPYFPFLLTGFEAGMIGYTLFTSVYGQDMYSTFGIVDIGQVSFVFTILVPMVLAMNSLKTESEEKQSPLMLSFKTAVKSPVVWSIFLGLALSIAGIWKFESNGFYIAADEVFGVISAPTSFLICLVIGNGIKLSFRGMQLELATSVLRVVLTMAFAFAIKFFLFRNIGMEPIYEKALFVMFILPAPYVIPAFMSNPSEEDKSFVANTLSIQTLFGLIGFIIITAIM
ncbi:MAG: AEC family transporter [Eubacteriales bacterium]